MTATSSEATSSEATSSEATSSEATSSAATTRTGTRVAIAISVASLLLSSWSLIMTLDNEADRGQIEQRLQCLELPGPNDCGPGS